MQRIKDDCIYYLNIGLILDLGHLERRIELRNVDIPVNDPANRTVSLPEERFLIICERRLTRSELL